VPPRRFLRTAAPIQAIDMDYASGRVPMTAPAPLPKAAAAGSKRTRPSTLDLGWDEAGDEDPFSPIERIETVAIETATESAPPLEPAPTPGAGPAIPLLTAREALAAMDSAVDRDEVGDALVGYLVACFGTGAVLICKRDAALGWRGYFPGVDADTVESITIALGVPSIFRAAFERHEILRGAPPASGRDIQDRFWKHLHCPPPAEVIVAPVMLRKRVINLLYAHAADGGPLPEGSGDHLDELCAAAAGAFVRIIQSKKGN